MKKTCLLMFVLGFGLMAQDLRGEEKAEYLEPSKAVPMGKAPGLKVKHLYGSKEVNHYLLVFAENDEVLTGLTDFANKYNIKSARFEGIGSFKRATSGWFDDAKKAFKLNRINEQVELVSLIGNITMVNGKPVVHTHFGAAFSDGHMEGGHMIEAYTHPTVEVYVTADPAEVTKKLDEKNEFAFD